MEIEMEIKDINNETIQKDTLTINSGDILLFKQTEFIPHNVLSMYIKQLETSLKRINQKREETPNNIIGMFIPQGLEVKIMKVKTKD